MARKSNKDCPVEGAPGVTHFSPRGLGRMSNGTQSESGVDTGSIAATRAEHPRPPTLSRPGASCSELTTPIPGSSVARLTEPSCQDGQFSEEERCGQVWNDRPGRRPYFVKPSATGGRHESVLHDRAKQRKRDRGEIPRCPSPVIHVRKLLRPSWVTGEGVSRKRKLIERKGLPGFQGWRFITLTLSQDRFENPLDGYLSASDHMRRFLHECRKRGLWKPSAKWAWKLEFQTNGWPHWHLLVSRKRKFTSADLTLLGKLWGLGRTNVEMVNERDFRYTFKYAFKAVQVGEPDEITDGSNFAPDWFLDHRTTKTVVVDGEEIQKPATLARVRFWQTCRGFYTGRRVPAKPAKPQETSMVPRSAREVLDQQSRTVLVIARTACGSYKASKVVTVTGNLQDFWNLSAFDIVMGGGVALAPYSYVIPTHRIKTNLLEQWQLKPLIESNKLRLPQAVRLQSRAETLLTC